MPPKLRSDDGRNIVIRPLIYCAEQELAEFAVQKAFPIIPCDLCGSQENLQRKQVKNLIDDLTAKNPHVRSNLFSALSNVRPHAHLDSKLQKALGIDLAAEPEAAPAELVPLRSCRVNAIPADVAEFWEAYAETIGGADETRPAKRSISATARSSRTSWPRSSSPEPSAPRACSGPRSAEQAPFPSPAISASSRIGRARRSASSKRKRWKSSPSIR